VAEHEVDHLLIGGGLASANCARWLREEGGGDSSIMLVGRELDPPYNRPPLSKGYLRGAESKQDALFRPDEWWEEQRIELLTRTSVMKLDAEARVATLSNKDTVRFDKARTSAGCASTAPSSTGSTTCAHSATPTRFAPTSRRPSGSCWSAAATSAASARPRSRRPSAPSARS
jgi:NADPH-dependent 2,4-dienoyl-CoA reductase/sulfur reductase-like enzyme